ncbi:unnamed protein product [Somion occarium]|uniref:Uncharacterized protein n=1 Tax=Somion occarium TaxID=3059160 RepID=A0ABP1DMQ6_9APHY
MDTNNKHPVNGDDKIKASASSLQSKADIRKKKRVKLGHSEREDDSESSTESQEESIEDEDLRKVKESSTKQPEEPDIEQSIDTSNAEQEIAEAFGMYCAVDDSEMAYDSAIGFGDYGRPDTRIGGVKMVAIQSKPEPIARPKPKPSEGVR